MEDFGSVYGTYIRIRDLEEITGTCSMLLGDEAILSVLGIYESGFSYAAEMYGTMYLDPHSQSFTCLLLTSTVRLI